MKILSGDIGGTKTLLEISEVLKGEIKVIARHRYESSAYSNFSNLLSDFLNQYDDSQQPTLSNACFGVAGPVQEIGNKTSSQVTNLPWLLDSDEISDQLKVKTIKIINDFVSVGYGIGILSRSELFNLQFGESRPKSTRLVIGAGTGLGVAQLVWCDGDYRVLGTEGGHTDFAPRNDVQIELLRYLNKKRGRASIESVLSGPGLVNIYRFLTEYRSGAKPQLSNILGQHDPAAAIAQAAESEADKVASEAMDIFVSIYGGVCGNFALSTMALGGVYIAGGIAPKIIKRLNSGTFIEAFCDKGKMANLAKKFSVEVVMNPDVGLIGTRYVASKLI